MATNNAMFSEIHEAAQVRQFPVRAALGLAERRMILATVDIALVVLALIITIAVRPELQLAPALDNSSLSQSISLGNDPLYAIALAIQSAWMSFSYRLAWIASLLIIWGVFAFLFECYEPARAAHLPSVFKRVSAAAIFTAAVYLVVPFVTPLLPQSRTDALIFPGVLLASLLAWRVFYALTLAGPDVYRRAIVVGAGRTEATLAHAIVGLGASDTFYRHVGYRILGMVDSEPQPASAQIGSVPVLGSTYDLVQIVRRLRPDDLIVADELVTPLPSRLSTLGQPQRRRSDLRSIALFDALLLSSEMGITITTTARYYEQLTGRVPVEYLGRTLHAAVPFEHSATQRLYLACRRLLDLAACLVGCMLLAAVLPLVWLANRWWSPGPLFYRQERVGQYGHTFFVTKFRSMVVDAEKYSGSVWAAENDPRITPVGRLLRKTRLDELPQFWNILVGEMSLIGPRPERPYFVEQLAQQIPLYRARHAMRPGLTGWAQVRYRYGASVEDALAKLEYDLYYLKHQGLLLDFEILIRTITVVLGLKGR